MATLKEHQAAMVDLLANGSGIPASASRLAHAMHDLIAAHLAVCEITFVNTDDVPRVVDTKRPQQTTPGLNDVALAQDIKALKVDAPCVKPSTAEQRIKQLNNTIRQLKRRVAELRYLESSQKEHIEHLQHELAQLRTEPEQAGCRKFDTEWSGVTGGAGHGLSDDGIDPVRSK